MKLPEKNILNLRLLVQWSFLAWCIALGIQFSLFVRHFESSGQAAFYARPPGVEGFLPIGSLVSLKAWLTSGYFDPVHPAALVLFLTFIGMALLTKKSFCSWLCPVGTLEEALWKTGQKLFGRNFRIWNWLDIALRFVKHILLIFFIKAILIDMPAQALKGFLNAPYWAIADIKMLHFFTAPSTLSIIVIVVLAVLSLIYKNFWCRYLCPYGALLGLFSFLSPLKVIRNPGACTDCGRCSKVCPARIDVRKKEVVRSVECTACLTCVGNCPEPQALTTGIEQTKIQLPNWSFAVGVLAVFAGGVILGMTTGHWETALSYEDYQFLIPQASRLGH
jgi:polyferredoxin